MEIVYDAKKLKTVKIDEIHPNSWNPKDIDTVEYQHIVTSLRKKGLRQPVIVRQMADYYEIIDGEQRWRGWHDLDKTEILIYNEGPDISDQEAKELMIAYQQQVPFNTIEYAQLLKDMMEQYENLELPIENDEIQDLIDMLDFSPEAPEDFPEYDDDIDTDYKCPKCQYEWSGQPK